MQPEEQIVNVDSVEAGIDWDDLYFDLRNNKAILVLGPEFYAKDGVSVRELLYQELTKKTDHGILHFYPSNGIYLFQSELYKNRAQKQSSQFYRSLHPDNDIVQKIIELPFRMIINTNPDNFLEKKYRDNGIACQFDYFTAKPKRKETAITDPDNFCPLIFNLFGSVDAYESIVLDFEDIFDHLKSLLNNINVSDVIRSVLNETDTYIFIGFSLEKWDTQLLFRYLNMKEHGFDDSKKNYTTRSLNIDNNSESFFRQQFNIKYYGAPVDFIDHLHKKFFEFFTKEDSEETKGLSPREVIIKYISADEIEMALNYLTVLCKKADPGREQELILIRSNFTSYMFKKTKKLDNTDALEIQRNRIKESVLDFINHLA